MNNFYSKDDPALSEHHNHITKHILTKKHITHTMLIKTNLIISRITDIQVNIITKTQKLNDTITNNISNKAIYLIMNMY